MGQYYKIVNIDKEEYINPHIFGDGAKLLEFGDSSNGTMTGLAILLADGNNRGGGDLQSDDEIIGSWAGDRVVIAGDYADGGKFIPKTVTTEELKKIAEEQYTEGYQDPERVNLYGYAGEKYKDVSEKVKQAMKDDPYLKKGLSERLSK